MIFSKSSGMAKKAIDRFSLRYRLFKTYVMLCHRLFYRKMQVKFPNNIPRDRPVLLAPNHQNALMDAMGPLFTSRRDPVFLTRADVFNNKFIAGVFRLFKMLPVYRIRDGASELSRNEEIFKETIEVLRRKKCPVCIMAEGNHGNMRRLRPLVKGIFRIAFQAQESFGSQPGVVIVPVGIDYSVYWNFRANLFIQYGEPVEVNEYYAEYLENQPRAINRLRERLSAEMGKYIINIQTEEHYDAFMMLRQVYNQRMRERLGFRKKDLYHRLLADQHMIRELARAGEKQPEQLSSLATRVKEYAEGVDSMKLRDWLFNKNRRSLLALLAATAGHLLLLPVFLYGMLMNLLPYHLFGRLARKLPDRQFHSTVKFVLGVFLMPVYYLLLFIAAWIWIEPGWIKWGFLLSLPVTGLIAHTWYIWFKKLRSLWKVQILTTGHSKELEKLKTLREKITDACETLIPSPVS